MTPERPYFRPDYEGPHKQLVDVMVPIIAEQLNLEEDEILDPKVLSPKHVNARQLIAYRLIQAGLRTVEVSEAMSCHFSHVGPWSRTVESKLRLSDDTQRIVDKLDEAIKKLQTDIEEQPQSDGSPTQVPP